MAGRHPLRSFVGLFSDYPNTYSTADLAPVELLNCLVDRHTDKFSRCALACSRCSEPTRFSGNVHRSRSCELFVHYSRNAEARKQLADLPNPDATQ